MKISAITAIACHAERSEAPYHAGTNRSDVIRCFTAFSMTDAKKPRLTNGQTGLFKIF
ncbi:hypothetical protein Q5H92_10360 [Hymenobacter sp. M29]|uniref:Uncharacterized protein n=1 Tax=Hymenobacter mellowenesis TaxID=3063995 RepID=A0ABT9AAA9_9BACT|nr:hypothetical protein [Hymenobacter sp. M29]